MAAPSASSSSSVGWRIVSTSPLESGWQSDKPFVKATRIGVMTALGFAHVVFAGLAIGSAAILLALRKGTTWHRRHGWFYVCNMAGLSITALLLYRLTGRFGPFHLAAIL